jgi:hypothetical protein
VAVEGVAVIVGADAATVGAPSFGDTAGAVGATVFRGESVGHWVRSPFLYSIDSGQGKP